MYHLLNELKRDPLLNIFPRLLKMGCPFPIIFGKLVIGEIGKES
jgi:hypothetical protein